ncbi:peptide chain release factor N(5)-glutamine methyltransferase [Microlunatus panaciterrae]|uniref:Release factor glutamine methyltransferase n=1 Tax=Microlunatus panaciterrae TaxID=400768 RepID=A0ABS2RHI9_9ACTN|nr:peptide chain release factor N(5)-glutamine methyltransferase [Microlunatus panaciterrae]MBM7797404.1 release factor glutamine methyltransferase [Microlunatus panaciterrae]
MAETRALLTRAAAQLVAAGIDSPQLDARRLLAHVLRVEPGRLLLIDSVTPAQAAEFELLVTRRAEREPLQHLTGVAYFRHVELEVGPGVFVPRPETEVMTGWAIDRLRELVQSGAQPVVVELCAGSGAISKAIADEIPGCEQYAVEVSADALAWAERNLAATEIRLQLGDMADALPELDGTVDLVIANPPYIPLEAYESVTPEVRDHDPFVALFSGDDGLDAMRVLCEVGARLLRPGGWLCAEHAEVQAESAPAVFVADGRYGQVRDHRDLTDRPRFVTARRRG